MNVFASAAEWEMIWTVPSKSLFSDVCNIHKTIIIEMMMMMISGATAQTGPWPPFTGFMIVL
jgi:hypothetical protein